MANEYILKDKVLNLIEHNDRVCHYADERYENVVYATAQTICVVVADIPAAEVQPVKHGRWECVGHDDTTYWYRCSVCGHEEHDNMTKHDKYCSSCGARMDLND